MMKFHIKIILCYAKEFFENIYKLYAYLSLAQILHVYLHTWPFVKLSIT